MGATPDSIVPGCYSYHTTEPTTEPTADTKQTAKVIEVPVNAIERPDQLKELIGARGEEVRA